MTSAADRQRLKRQRRAEAGMVKVEVWLSAEEAAWVVKMADDADDTMSGRIAWCVRSTMKVVG